MEYIWICGQSALGKGTLIQKRLKELATQAIFAVSGKVKGITNKEEVGNIEDLVALATNPVGPDFVFLKHQYGFDEDPCNYIPRLVEATRHIDCNHRMIVLWRESEGHLESMREKYSDQLTQGFHTKTGEDAIKWHQDHWRGRFEHHKRVAAANGLTIEVRNANGFRYTVEEPNF